MTYPSLPYHSVNLPFMLYCHYKNFKPNQKVYYLRHLSIVLSIPFHYHHVLSMYLNTFHKTSLTTNSIRSFFEIQGWPCTTRDSANIPSLSFVWSQILGTRMHPPSTKLESHLLLIPYQYMCDLYSITALNPLTDTPSRVSLSLKSINSPHSFTISACTPYIPPVFYSRIFMYPLSSLSLLYRHHDALTQPKPNMFIFSSL